MDGSTDQGLAPPTVIPFAAEHGAHDDQGPGRLGHLEREWAQESFADFERAVLQDNIILCDTKSGVLLAFTGAMVLFALDSFTKATGAAWLGRSGAVLAPGAFLISAAALLVSCASSLSTVWPRLRRTPSGGHVFWESTAFTGPAEAYMREMRNLPLAVQYDEKLLHLYTLAGVCRAKYSHLRHAMYFALVGFLMLLVAELIKA